MNDSDPNIRHYMAELEGEKGSDAFHRIREAGSAALPHLQSALRAAKSSRIKAQIVELLWQTREPSVVGSLADALNDRAPEVWKAALDGLVTIGVPQLPAYCGKHSRRPNAVSITSRRNGCGRRWSSMKRPTEATRSNSGLDPTASRVTALAGQAPRHSGRGSGVR